MAGNNILAQARSLALLGIILQTLHLLFGITAIIGVLIAHVRIHTTADTLYHSQIRWQIITFWSGLLAYSLAVFVWLHHDLNWPMYIALLYSLYRIATSYWYWSVQQPIHRLI